MLSLESLRQIRGHEHLLEPRQKCRLSLGQFLLTVPEQVDIHVNDSLPWRQAAQTGLSEAQHLAATQQGQADTLAQQVVQLSAMQKTKPKARPRAAALTKKAPRTG